jgi:hypothetical protein
MSLTAGPTVFIDYGIFVSTAVSTDVNKLDNFPYLAKSNMMLRSHHLSCVYLSYAVQLPRAIPAEGHSDGDDGNRLAIIQAWSTSNVKSLERARLNTRGKAKFEENDKLCSVITHSLY